MSDTPRTDADCWDTVAGAARCKPTTEHAYVPASLARRLERENTALQEALERADMALEMLGIGSNVPVRFIARDAINYAARKETQT